MDTMKEKKEQKKETWQKEWKKEIKKNEGIGMRQEEKNRRRRGEEKMDKWAAGRHKKERQDEDKYREEKME
jgi:hypothetical protein